MKQISLLPHCLVRRLSILSLFLLFPFSLFCLYIWSSCLPIATAIRTLVSPIQPRSNSSSEVQGIILATIAQFRFTLTVLLQNNQLKSLDHECKRGLRPQEKGTISSA